MSIIFILLLNLREKELIKSNILGCKAKSTAGNSHRVFQNKTIKALDDSLIHWVALSAKSCNNTKNTGAESAHCRNLAFNSKSNELSWFQYWEFKKEKVLD